METAVIEMLRTPELQRLRRVRQLGLAHLVFPGAEHSRLVHSIGASHLAIRFVTQLQETSRGFLPEALGVTSSVVRDIALAALCHDIGHGPLSHVWEKAVVGKRYNAKNWCEQLGLVYEDSFMHLKWHELVGQALLAWDEGPLHRLLE
jgi:HD superfamily phosphohydrolase